MRSTLIEITAGLALVESLQNLLRKVALRVTLLQLLAGVTLMLAGAALGVAARADEITAKLDQDMRQEVFQDLKQGVETLYHQSQSGAFRPVDAGSTAREVKSGPDKDVAQAESTHPVRATH
jgi:hypothetical protein